MSLAAETREAVRARPFLFDALRAGVVNYSAAATWLANDADLDGDSDAVATALRRFREELPTYATAERSATVSMQSGVSVIEEPAGNGEDTLLRLPGVAVVPDGGDTAVIATGNVDATALAATIDRLRTADIFPAAAGIAGNALLVVVKRRAGATAIRVVEGALAATPETG